MKEGYVIRNQHLPHFVTFTVTGWVDVFSRESYRKIVVESLRYCINNRQMLLYGYVIMSNHIHLILQSGDGKLSDLIRDSKKFMAKSILDAIQSEPESRREWMLEIFSRAAAQNSRNKHFQFWQAGNHAVEIYSAPFFWTKLHYIHLNPVRAGIVRHSWEYLYSSAPDYHGQEGLLPIVIETEFRNATDFSVIRQVWNDR